MARTLLVGGGALWVLSLLAELIGPGTTVAGGVGTLHLWFSGITVVLALLTVVSPRLARHDKRIDGRHETIGYVLTGMLAVIAVFYAHAAVFDSGANVPQQIESAAPVSNGVACEVPEDRSEELDTPGLCAAPTVSHSTGVSHAVFTPPDRPAVARPRR